MLSRWLESNVLVLATVAMMSCSSDETSEPDGDVSGSGGSNSAGTGNQTAGGGGSSGNVGGMGGTTNATGGTGNAGGATGAGEPPSFASDIWPILTANCGSISCHGDGSFLPQHAHSDVDIAYEEAMPVADLIAGRVSGQLMPIMPQFCGPAPGLGDCLSVAEVALIQAWADAGAPD